MATLRKTWRLLVIPVAALAFFLGAYFYHYRGTYDAPATPDAGLAQITAPYSSFTSFVEVPPVREGTFLVDGTHANDFTKAELSTLLSRVVDRGYDVQLVGEISPFSGFRFMTLSERLPLLEGGLRQADSFAVILPEEPYEKEELAIVERFVQKGESSCCLAILPGKARSTAWRSGSASASSPTTCTTLRSTT